MPQLSGGGAKDTKFAQTQASLAQIFLAQGVSLSDTAVLTDKLMPLAGLQKVYRVTQLASQDLRWQEVCALCHQFGLSLPPVEDRLARASKVVAKGPENVRPSNSLCVRGTSNCSLPSSALKQGKWPRSWVSSFQAVQVCVWWITRMLRSCCKPFRVPVLMSWRLSSSEVARIARTAKARSPVQPLMCRLSQSSSVAVSIN